MAELAIVVPTISGREHWLERCIAGYEHTTPVYYEGVIVENEPSCGRAWNVGIEQILARHPEVSYIHLTADDIVPHEGWYEAAVASVKRGELPAPRILNPDGSLQSCGDADELPDGTVVEIARIPFASKQQMECIGPIIDIHYYTDNWFSYRGRQCGLPSVVNRKYLFTHHLAQEGRIDSLAEDGRAYFRAAK